MRKQISLFTISILYFANMAICQSNKLFEHINNDSIKFSVFRMSPTFIDKNTVSTVNNLVKVSIDSSDSLILRKMSVADWIKALSDPQTDWAANLLLYDLHEKDGSIFIVVKNREEWIRTSKESDVEYWKKILK